MPTGLTPIQCEVAVPTDSEAIDTLVDLLMQGPSDALMETIERHARQADASPDLLSVCALAALTVGRGELALPLTERAKAARNLWVLEDATILAFESASNRRFSWAVDMLRASVTAHVAAPRLFPAIATARFEILMHAATEADIPVLDTDTGRLLSPDEVRAEAVQQVQTEMSVCVERCRGTAQARWMASVLVHLGTRAGNTKGNWGHVFATVARMIDADVRGAEALLLPVQ